MVLRESKDYLNYFDIIISLGTGFVFVLL